MMQKIKILSKMGRKLKFQEDDFVKKCCAIFATRGYVGTSTRDIMKETGVELASIYNKFKNKENLFITALTYYIANIFIKELKTSINNKKSANNSILLIGLIEINNFKKNYANEIRNLVNEAMAICRKFGKEHNLNKNENEIFEEFLLGNILGKLGTKAVNKIVVAKPQIKIAKKSARTTKNSTKNKKVAVQASLF